MQRRSFQIQTPRRPRTTFDHKSVRIRPLTQTYSSSRRNSPVKCEFFSWMGPCNEIFRTTLTFRADFYAACMHKGESYTYHVMLCLKLKLIFSVKMQSDNWILNHFGLSRCPFVPGQFRNFCPFVPKSCTVPFRWKTVNFMIATQIWMFCIALKNSLQAWYKLTLARLFKMFFQLWNQSGCWNPALFYSSKTKGRLLRSSY